MSEPNQESPPEGWKNLLVEFIDARLSLIRLEARDAGKEAARRGAIVVMITGAGLATWGLTLAGIIGWISANREWPWYFVALGIALLHLIIAAAGLLLLKQRSAPSFPLTRSELAKDREWLQTINNQENSKR